MNKDETVKDMAKILCPKGTANCEKCSKNYKCDVKFSQLAQLVDGGCLIVGDDEIVVKKSELEGMQIEKDFNYGYYEGEANMTAYYENIKLPEVRKETVREILQELWSKRLSLSELQFAICWLAAGNGIELE